MIRKITMLDVLPFRWGEQVFTAATVWRVVWRRPRLGVLYVVPDYFARLMRWWLERGGQ